MANKREYQFLYSKVPKLSVRYGAITFGGSGSVASSSSGTGGVSSVTKLGTGIYQIKLIDNFYAYIKSDFNFQSGTSGAAVGDGTFSTNGLYQIVTVGTTDWGSLGLPAGYGTAAGMVLVTSGTGDGAKTGVAKLISATGSGIRTVEVVQSASAYLTNLLPNMNTGTAGAGSSIVFQCLTDTGAGTTTLIATNPAAGSVLNFAISFRDSSAQAV